MNKKMLFSAVSVAMCALLAQSAVEVPSGKPDLVFGVISDVHLVKEGDEKTLLTALEYFRDHGADGVMVAGDLSMSGYLKQLVLFGDCWRRVFPDNRAPDGRTVEKLFVYGDHDTEHWRHVLKPEKITNETCRALLAVPEHRAAAWEKAFGEKYEPIWLKRVKGFAFVGAHFPSIKDAPTFVQAHADELKGEKPFFYVQHTHLKDTCMGAWAWGHDNGAMTAVLTNFPNAVAFSGHSHYTLTDERSVWQGAFTSFNTSSLYYSSRDWSLRENFWGNSSGYRGDTRKHLMATIEANDGRQGMLVSVYGKKLVVERRDFVYGKSLGPKWVLDIPGGPDATFSARKARRSAPEFAPDAVPTVKPHPWNKKLIVVSFPRAQTVDGCRAFEYEVTATLVEDDVDLVQAQRRVMPDDYYLADEPDGKRGWCAFSREELPYGHYVFTVRPVECFGKKGRPVETELVDLPKLQEEK